MSVHFTDAHLLVHVGDVRDCLRELPEQSVHTVVTSPPYWGLRDYGTPGQIGLERTPEEYVATMVDVFREVRRVLRDDGTLWLNLGDSYAGGGAAGSEAAFRGKQGTHKGGMRVGPANVAPGLKPKDLVGIPWRVAFALQADGWYLRSDIIWAKPNPMPESVTDRPTKAHEYVFLLSKSARYWYDADAVREDPAPQSMARIAQPNFANQTGGPKDYANGTNPNRSMRQTLENFAANPGRNLRSVWTIATEPYPGAHFATFPRKLVEPCVKAGTSERGVCSECGEPWERVVRVSANGRTVEKVASQRTSSVDGEPLVGDNRIDIGNRAAWGGGVVADRTEAGWQSSCAHAALRPVPATVLDPFAGSGTTGFVANALGRRAVLIDLNADYIDQAMKRNAQAPLGIGA